MTSPLGPHAPVGETPESTQPTPPLDDDRRNPDAESDISAADEQSGDTEPAQLLATRLRAHSLRLRTAKVRAEFEQTLLTVLTLNVIYTYYLDHTFLVFVIRASQLLYLPYAHSSMQSRTTMSLILSSMLVLTIHNFLFVDGKPIGQMLFINFIGPEPKSFTKLIAIDVLVILLQAMLLQVKWDGASLKPISILPLPISQPLQTPDEEAET